MLPVVANVGSHAGNGTGNRAAASCGEHRVEGISIAAQIDVEIFPPLTDQGELTPSLLSMPPPMVRSAA